MQTKAEMNGLWQQRQDSYLVDIMVKSITELIWVICFCSSDSSIKWERVEEEYLHFHARISTIAGKIPLDIGRT